MIAKEEANHIISKAADIALLKAKNPGIQGTLRELLYDYCYYYFEGSNATFKEIYDLILRAIINVEVVLEELKEEKDGR